MQKVRIDIVSDVMCPWCAIGFYSLNMALEALADKVEADIHWQPFELNPSMPMHGQNMREHLIEKYGMSVAESDENRAMISERGAAVGFAFQFSDDMNMWNTFDAHQLLHWVGETKQGAQTELKKSLFAAHFQQHKNVSDTEVLLELVAKVGLDKDEARAVLAEQRYALAVRAQQQQWQESGIHSVPAFVINQQYLISGGQPPEAFIEAIAQIVSNA